MPPVMRGSFPRYVQMFLVLRHGLRADAGYVLQIARLGERLGGLPAAVFDNPPGQGRSDTIQPTKGSLRSRVGIDLLRRGAALLRIDNRIAAAVQPDGRLHTVYDKGASAGQTEQNQTGQVAPSPCHVVAFRGRGGNHLPWFLERLLFLRFC